MHKSILLILPVDEKHLINFLIIGRLYIVFYKDELKYHFVVHNKNIKIINKTKYLQQKVGKDNIKNKITSICLNDIFAKIYNIVICSI